ncbi:hypothetical protein LBMAG57_30960 [Verrucomicrobiota bacterium]|jgi:ABC-type transport system involved in cytochrome bd biosynthesis fused ATPase/permease subunit|nr:hypothetical protein LBMAG57_30960 [Verrucomicrobiota bacterium]
MKTFLLSVLAAVVFLIPAHAVAAAKSQAFHEKITSVNAKEHTNTVTEKKTGKSQTFTARHASVTVDKQKHKHLADLRIGMKAKVKHGGKSHLEIVAKTHSANKKRKTAV